jgi:exodeoxyribonuclease VII small subunit
VSSAAKNQSQEPAAAKTENLRFEDALTRLEGIVEAMEGEELPLETLLSKYEEGTRLAKVCQEKLTAADLKIQQLEKSAAGEMKLKPIDVAEDV